MPLLPPRIRARQHRPGFAKPEIQVPEQTLALSHAQLNPITFVDPGRQRLAIPQVHAHAGVARLGSQHAVDFLDLLWVQATRTPRSFTLHQTTQTPLLKTMHPVLHRTRSITQQTRHFWARHTLSNQQHAVQTVIVARFLGTLDLLL